MIKKLGFLFLILIVLYGVSIFTLPQLSSTVDTLIGISGFSEKVRGSKDNFDGVVTNIPSLQEVRSGAVDAQEKILNGIDTTKDTIDTIREGAQKAEETYNDAKETLDQAKQTFDNAKEVFDDVTHKVNQIGEVVESVQNITEASQ